MPRIHTILGKGDKEINPPIPDSFFKFSDRESDKNITKSEKFILKKVGVIFGRIGCCGNIKILESQINFPIFVLPFEFLDR